MGRGARVNICLDLSVNYRALWSSSRLAAFLFLALEQAGHPFLQLGDCGTSVRITFTDLHHDRPQR